MRVRCVYLVWLVLLLPAVAVAPPWDFGDLPDSYLTLRASNGCRHVPIGPMLGFLRDIDADGLPSAGADGDDNSASDDEDGIVFLDPLIPGGTARVQITISGGNARVTALIDWHRNGMFENIPPYDIAIHNILYPAGTTIQVINVPLFAVPGPTCARFRLYTNDAPGGGFFGEGDDGEVEDYPVTIEATTPTEDSAWGRVKALFR
jgi:hypothetical protein